VWSKNSYGLWSEIQDLPQLRFLPFKFLFDLLALIYVGKQGKPPNNTACASS
jgi:hypothetical protein